VDGFQGQEKDIIIFSCVRASQSGSVGFLADIRRMNVALTRARQSLFILGHADTLRREEIWGDLVRDAEQRGLFTKVSPCRPEPSLVLKEKSRDGKESL